MGSEPQRQREQTERTEQTDAEPQPAPVGPSVKQLLHWATGDRKAEGEALAESAGTGVDAEAGELAVKRAHGDLGAGAFDQTDHDIADIADAQDAARSR